MIFFCRTKDGDLGGKGRLLPATGSVRTGQENGNGSFRSWRYNRVSATGSDFLASFLSRIGIVRYTRTLPGESNDVRGKISTNRPGLKRLYNALQSTIFPSPYHPPIFDPENRSYASSEEANRKSPSRVTTNFTDSGK